MKENKYTTLLFVSILIVYTSMYVLCSLFGFPVIFYYIEYVQWSVIILALWVGYVNRNTKQVQWASAISLALICSLINAILYYDKVGVFIYIPCFVLFFLFRKIKQSIIKTVGKVIITILISFTLFIGFMSLTIARIGVAEPSIDYFPSKSSKYIAKVMQFDQGALRGNIKVVVQDTSKIGYFLIGEVSLSETTVYENSEWEDIKEWKVHWKGDHTLVINGSKFHFD